MPTTEDDRQRRASLLHRLRDAYRRSNCWTRKDRNAKAQRVGGFSEDFVLVVGRSDIVDQLDIKPCLQQWRCQREHAQRCAQRRTIVRRIKEYYFVFSWQLNPSGSDWEFYF